MKNDDLYTLNVINELFSALRVSEERKHDPLQGHRADDKCGVEAPHFSKDIEAWSLISGVEELVREHHTRDVLTYIFRFATPIGVAQGRGTDKVAFVMKYESDGDTYIGWRLDTVIPCV